MEEAEASADASVVEISSDTLVPDRVIPLFKKAILKMSS